MRIKDFSNDRVIHSTIGDKSIDQGLRSYMLKVYNYMGLGLSFTGIVAFLVASSPSLQALFFATPLIWAVTFGALGIALFFTFNANQVQFLTAQVLFWVYAALIGISLSSILIMYTGQSVARIFFITASTFGGMSLYGYTTKRDLSGLTSFFFMGLLGIVLASLVNLFLASTALQFSLSVMTVFLFTGLTAYDTQMIRDNYEELLPVEAQSKRALLSALQLYLDCINIFVSLIHLFGERK